MEFTFVLDAHLLILELFQDLQPRFILIFLHISPTLKILKIHVFHLFNLMYLYFIVPTLCDFINLFEFFNYFKHYPKYFLNPQQS